MTILGIPEGNGFAIGTSSNIAPSTGVISKMDMSLDDMIKSRRTAPRVAATGVDRQVAKGKAKRAAAANARRGLATTAQPTAKEIEMEVVRQTRRSTSSTKKLKEQQQQQAPVRGRKPRSQADIKTKARQEKKAGTPNKKQNAASDNAIPPTWIGGTRRPPSKKAVTAAVEAMQQSGFKVPKGMQMVISFAPAPDHFPAGNNEFGGNASAKKKQPNSNNNNNNSAKKPPNTKSNNNNNNSAKGGGGRGGGGRRN